MTTATIDQAQTGAKREQLLAMGALVVSGDAEIRRSLNPCRVTRPSEARRAEVESLIHAAGMEYAPGMEDRVLTFAGSDETPDRCNTIVRVDGWELDNYRKNPVFMWAHDYSQPPIGRTIRVEKMTESDGRGGTRKALAFDVLFVDAATYPFADMVFRMYRDGFLHATSVGWRTIDSRYIQDEAEAKAMGLDASDFWMAPEEITRQDLLELSAAPVPANPNALKRAVAAGILDEAMAVRLFQGRAIEKREEHSPEYMALTEKVEALTARVSACEEKIKGMEMPKEEQEASIVGGDQEVLNELRSIRAALAAAAK